MATQGNQGASMDLDKGFQPILPKVGKPVDGETYANLRPNVVDKMGGDITPIINAIGGKYKGMDGDTFLTDIKNADKRLDEGVAAGFNYVLNNSSDFQNDIGTLVSQFYNDNNIIQQYINRLSNIYQPDEYIKMIVTYIVNIDSVDIGNDVKKNVVRSIQDIIFNPRLRFGGDATIPTDNIQSGIAKVLLPNYRGRSIKYFYYSILSDKLFERVYDLVTRIQDYPRESVARVLRSILRAMVYTGTISMEDLFKSMAKFMVIVDNNNNYTIDGDVNGTQVTFEGVDIRNIPFIDVVFPTEGNDERSIRFMDWIIQNNDLFPAFSRAILISIESYGYLVDNAKSGKKSTTLHPIVAYGQVARLRKYLNNSVYVIRDGETLELTPEVKQGLVKEFEGKNVEERGTFLRQLRFIENPDLTAQQKETYPPYTPITNDKGQKMYVPHKEGDCLIEFTGVGVDTDVSRTAVNPVLRLKKVLNKDGIASCRGRSVLRDLENPSLKKQTLEALGGEAYVNAKNTLGEHYKKVVREGKGMVLNQRELRLAGVDSRERRDIINRLGTVGVSGGQDGTVTLGATGPVGPNNQQNVQINQQNVQSNPSNIRRPRKKQKK